MSGHRAMDAGAGGRVRLGSLELGRGIASLAVVAHHAASSAGAFTGQQSPDWFRHGALGVDFFFVLSGFIIYHTHAGQSGMAAARQYLARRVRRIYVPYLPIAALLVAAYWLLPGLSQGDREWGLFTTLTLLPSGAPPALSVAWTLVFEMAFYLVFLVSFFTSRFWLFVVAWAVATIARSVLGGGGPCWRCCFTHSFLNSSRGC